MSEQTRAKRETESRESVARPARWQPPRLLPDPNPEPGYAFRWIRMSLMGQSDPQNLTSKLAEGWEPVKASDHPEIRLMSRGTQDFPDSIQIGGLILCKTPVEFVQDRDAYYLQQGEAQMQSVDNNFMRENDPRMRKFSERNTKVTFGKGF